MMTSDSRKRAAEAERVAQSPPAPVDMAEGLSLSLAEVGRFWARVSKTTACWNWTGSITDQGYGQFSSGGRTWRAHRVSYTLTVGPPPPELVLDHICRNRACVRPEHLRAVTNAENILAGISPSAINARKTHCIYGHEFTEENTGRDHHGLPRHHREIHEGLADTADCQECGQTMRAYNLKRHMRRRHASAVLGEDAGGDGR